MNDLARAKAFLEKLKTERQPVFSSDTFAKVTELAKDPQRARKFLQEGGFLDENGQLAQKYRS